MQARLWGVRGSIPVPGHATEQFGGNTSCVQVIGEDGLEFVLDAGTGIRELGAALAGRSHRLHVLLTHLHLDHIQGLMFFAPFSIARSRSPSGVRRRQDARCARVLPATSPTRSPRSRSASFPPR
jgi:phosphoribosyl 1,2-cyclic phosphodiesterase